MNGHGPFYSLTYCAQCRWWASPCLDVPGHRRCEHPFVGQEHAQGFGCQDGEPYGGGHFATGPLFGCSHGEPGPHESLREFVVACLPPHLSRRVLTKWKGIDTWPTMQEVLSTSNPRATLLKYRGMGNKVVELLWDRLVELGYGKPK